MFKKFFFLLFIILLIKITAGAQTYYLFVGTYTDSGSKGIYVYTFNATTGMYQLISNTDSVVNPSYLAISANQKYLYAVNETNHAISGAISSFSFNKKTGMLKFLNKTPTGGDDPCFVSVTKNNQWAFVANYSGGSVSAIPIRTDGLLGKYSQLIQFSGSGTNKDRQKGPHVHAAVLSSDEKFVFTPDLGTDRLMEYKFNGTKKYPLTPYKPAYFATTGGSGPRHFTFSPDHKFAYLIQELSGMVSAFMYHEGILKFIQSISTHPDDYNGKPGSADIHISPDGNFLYASNRGEENNIAIFRINKSSGKLTLKGFTPSGGKTPRNFIIEPSGKYLLVANQNTNNIVIYKRDKLTGSLTPTGQEISIPKPVCLQMMSK